MYSAEELNCITSNENFISDYCSIKQSLVNTRIKQPVLLAQGAQNRLAHFVEAVLASAPDWSQNEQEKLCRISAEISEALAAKGLESDLSRRMRIRAALLYEMASLPALAGAVLKDGDLPDILLSFFRRNDLFGSLSDSNYIEKENEPPSALLGALCFIDDAYKYAEANNEIDKGKLESLKKESVSSVAWEIGKSFDIGFTASEVRAFSALMSNRVNRATIYKVEDYLFPSLTRMNFPVELLPAQFEAVNGGLLKQSLPSWGFAAPTGSGKTFLARLLIADVLLASEENKIIYLVPSKALVSEVATALSGSFKSLGVHVLALSAQLVDLDERECREIDDASVVVMTPEKADMLLRLGVDFLRSVSLAIIDEAHHIESGTRGALLELYLWRMKRLLPKKCRYVFLSAVAPNIKEIVRWVDPQGESVAYNNRPTRMRIGIYSIQGKGKMAKSVIKYTDDTKIEVCGQSAENTIRRGICELAKFLNPAGPVLVVAKGKKECENIAKELMDWLKKRGELLNLGEDDLSSDSFCSLDARLEREMYSEVALRSLVKHRIAYHHAGLPPSVRQGIENAIRKKQIDYVIATTTLAEGVNFPFSSVIVQSLALREAPEYGRPSKYSPVTPRTFWNIAGRAGRPGFDPEGQVILFEASLGLDKIGAIIDDYTKPDMTSLTPVKSALASAFEEIQKEIEMEEYEVEHLNEVNLPKNMSKKARGAINLIRIGLLHARAENLISSPEEILESSFANHFLSDDEKSKAKKIIVSQNEVISKYLNNNEGKEDAKSMAELGLSLETLSELKAYVSGLENWKISNFSKLLYGGEVNIEQAKYIISPVAKRMCELEGPALGGYLNDVIVHWLSGATFTSIRAQSKFSQRLEDLVAVMYSRVQFLLPWGLWATDWLIQKEASKRNINYDNQVKQIAYLVDAGVPNFNALTLSHMGFERVDSTRLSRAYAKAGGLELGTDCVGWLLSRPRPHLENIIRGVDNRGIEFGFFDRIENLRN